MITRIRENVQTPLKNILLCILCFIVILLIIMLSVLPARLLYPIRGYINIKTGHKIAYFTLTLIIVAFLRISLKIKPIQAYFYTLLFSTSLGAFLELCQVFSVTRGGTLKDIAINFSGACIGILFCFYFELFYGVLKKGK
jgi:hypothetical protein